LNFPSATSRGKDGIIFADDEPGVTNVPARAASLGESHEPAQYLLLMLVWPCSDGQPKDRVFESLPGSKVQYAPDLRDRISTGIRPDRVVGLFNGPKSTTLLDAPSRADSAKRVGDLVKSDIFVQEDPYVQDDSAMIFPFLVLEAKQARAPDSLEDIERQMAFPAYEMLRAQNQLLESSAVSEASDRLPRVWPVSFKAQIWRLYVATMEQDENEEYDYVSSPGCLRL
jgi:hypothetical protein